MKPIIGGDSSVRERDVNNDHDDNTVNIIYNNLTSRDISRNVPDFMSKRWSKFGQFPNHDIWIVATFNRVSRGVGLGLKLPVD